MRHPLIDTEPYEIAFRLLLEDLERLFQFIEPTDVNRGVFSHRTYELFLRACTEFESICKDLMVAKNLSATGRDFDVRDYVQLEEHFALERVEIGLSRWDPGPLNLAPFDGWRARLASGDSPLPWYQAYNRVKHNRREKFSEASLIHTVTSMGALFLLLATASDFVLKGQERSSDGQRFYYSLGPFFSAFPPRLKELQPKPETGKEKPV